MIGAIVCHQILVGNFRHLPILKEDGRVELGDQGATWRPREPQTDISGGLSLYGQINFLTLNEGLSDASGE